MIAVDTNILVYAHRLDSPFNESAYDALKQLAHRRSSWAIPWPCLHEFYAVVTHPRIFDPPTSPDAALDQIDAWCSSPSLVLLGEGATHLRTLRELAVAGDVVGGRIHDARIAALCLQHNVTELWSADRDFSRFPKLATRNPLA